MPFALHHQILTAPGDAPRACALFLHGLLGQGQNWRTPALRAIARDPAWGAVLVDLRLHGRSLGAPPPHTLASAADDVEALATALARDGMPVAALIGHSFGGKVALELRRRAPAGLRATSVFDASPSAQTTAEIAAAEARPGGVLAVLAALRAVPRRYRRRDDLVAALAGQGLTAPIGKWLAMSLVPADDGYQLAFDLEGVGALLADHLATDLWSAVEDPALPGALAFFVAGRADTLSAADRARLLALAPRVTTTIFEDADHWMLAEREHFELPELPPRAPI